MIEHYKNKKYRVKTPTGFRDFVGIRRTTKAEVIEIIFQDDTRLECSLDHIFVINDIEILGRDIRVGQKLATNKIVSSLSLKQNKGFLYDLVGVEGESLYITDEIVSHNCDFASSGNTLVDPNLIQWYLQTTTMEPTEKRGFDNGYWVWELPDYKKTYIVTADVARGDGSDYSAFHVLDAESLTQVAEYKGQLTTKDFGNMLVGVATEWNDALLVVENNNIGWATIQQIIDRDYKNLYYTYKSDVLDSDVFLAKGYDVVNKTDMVAGFTMSHKVRPLAISKFDLLTREKSLIFRSKRFMDELSTFIWKDGKAQAANGYNDDLVLCMCQGIWVRDTALRLRQAGIDITKAALNATRNNATIYTGAMQRNETWRHDVGGKSEDLTWLL